ncbi:hypothetical protein RF11_14324 [Thelohanellus kitauei]|uniref:Uncharacterized protein n=1 Tax=Thelohanellus kitauei TaxID=669202 RepID=A0A0C2MTU3_THEKT|nr:hypothetical protein RF11_14324 [Thelohanellus kitauei]
MKLCEILSLYLIFICPIICLHNEHNGWRTCYQVMNLRKYTTVNFKFQNAFFIRPNYMYMKVNIKHMDSMNWSNFYTKKIGYHLKRLPNKCGTTLPISNDFHLEEVLEFKVYFSVHENETYFSHFHFWLHKEQKGNELLIYDLDYIMIMEVRIRKDRLVIVHHL